MNLLEQETVSGRVFTKSLSTVIDREKWK